MSSKDFGLSIEISRIPEEGLLLKREDAPSSYGLEEAGLSPSENVCLQGKIKKTPKGAFLEGRVSTVLELECGRCLCRFSFHVQSELRIFFLPEYKASQEHERELVFEDLDTYYYEGTEIDIVDPVRDQIVVAIPMQPLCSPDCPGLCPTCGKNLRENKCSCQPDVEVDHRLSVLKNLLN